MALVARFRGLKVCDFDDGFHGNGTPDQIKLYIFSNILSLSLSIVKINIFWVGALNGPYPIYFFQMFNIITAYLSLKNNPYTWIKQQVPKKIYMPRNNYDTFPVMPAQECSDLTSYSIMTSYLGSSAK